MKIREGTDTEPWSMTCEDADGDGFGQGLGCLGSDCDDADPNLGAWGQRDCYSGPKASVGVGPCSVGKQTCADGVLSECIGEVVPAQEHCNGVDDDCDGEADEGLLRLCYSGPDGSAGVGICAFGFARCADGAWGECAEERVPADEKCNGLDDDCDGKVDEGVRRACYTGPKETDSVGSCAAGSQACDTGEWGACMGETLPAEEQCDGLDNDCDGAVDEALIRSCYDGPSGTAGVGICGEGTSACAAGVWGSCVGQVLPGTESCDGRDEDCDGAVDESLSRSCYDGQSGTAGVGLCRDGTSTCAAGAWGSCVGQVLPGTESCDGRDEDCDGTADESLSRSCYDGQSGTAGVGICRHGTSTCAAAAWGSCVGQVLPGSESCDGRDEDCDGEVDESLIRSCYDGQSGTAGVGLCRDGTSTCAAGVWGACVGQVLPGTESCDGGDEDCNGEVDDAVTRSCYSGSSGSAGTGLCQTGLETCSAGAWSSCVGEVLPVSETCDGADNDCDGQQDENETVYTQDGSSQSVSPVYRPVDIILVVDNSPSMTNEIVAVQNNINGSFAAIMDQSGLDYRVIMLSKHGSATYNQSICIRPPLSGNTSCSTSCPTNGPRFFHYSTEIGSNDSLYRILSTYRTSDACGRAPGGWYQWLRPGAARVFIEITDDGPNSGDPYVQNRMTADDFEAQLFALNPQAFGSAGARNYAFHSIVGLDENSPVTAAWPATSPLVYDTCYGDVRQNGLEYQKLSQRTGGLRYPICQYQSFDAVFREVALGIIESTEMACDFQISSVPADSAMENTRLDLVPSNGGGRVGLALVANAAACTGNAFYTEGTVIKLCPEACTLWRDDPLAQIEVRFTCQQTIQ